MNTCSRGNPGAVGAEGTMIMTMQDSSYTTIRERFNDAAVARTYVRKKNALDSSKNRREMDCIVRALDGVAAGSRVLDLPCGSGRLEGMLLARGYQVVAADYSLPMIEAAKAYYREQSLDADAAARLTFEQQDVLATTFDDDSFDVVICNRLLHHYPQADTRRAVLAELRRICRGKLVVSYYDRFAFSAMRYFLRKRLRGVKPVDRVPVPSSTFRADYTSAGFRLLRTLPVRYGISAQTYLLLQAV